MSLTYNSTLFINTVVLKTTRIRVVCVIFCGRAHGIRVYARDGVLERIYVGNNAINHVFIL
jgi:hypothetical protein